ncbi:MAG: hypothetical protein U1E34_10150 [Amaricoccus sp.]
MFYAIVYLFASYPPAEMSSRYESVAHCLGVGQIAYADILQDDEIKNKPIGFACVEVSK